MGFLFDALIGVVAVVILAIIILVISVFNGFVSKRNRVQDAWAQIDVQLKRRYDLIPNLINAVKGYMTYEKSVLTQVTQLRTSIMNGSAAAKADANNQLSQALKSIFAVAENYPDLKASQNFMNLQQQLMDTEDKIAFVRTSYNDYVLDYNNALQEFPGNVFATKFGFKKADFFQTPAEQKENVKVDFSDVNNATAGKDKPAVQPKPAKK
jgi:LemA protein